MSVNSHHRALPGEAMQLLFINHRFQGKIFELLLARRIEQFLDRRIWIA